MGFKQARINAGLSVRQVMKALNVSDAAVYQWETGVFLPSTKRLPEIFIFVPERQKILHAVVIEKSEHDSEEDGAPEATFRPESVPNRDCLVHCAFPFKGIRGRDAACGIPPKPHISSPDVRNCM